MSYSINSYQLIDPNDGEAVKVEVWSYGDPDGNDDIYIFEDGDDYPPMRISIPNCTLGYILGLLEGSWEIDKIAKPLINK